MIDPGLKPQICVVCMANYCRSPVAEKILQWHFKENFRVVSKGLLPINTVGMDPRSHNFLLENGYPSSNHIPRKFTSQTWKESRLILAMDMHVLLGVNRIVGSISEKVKLFTYQSEENHIMDPYKLKDPETYNLVMNKIEKVALEIEL